MKRIFAFVATLSSFIAIVHAQDVIIFRNGNEVQAKVSEVTPAEIKYHRFDNPSGPLYTIHRSEVFMIKYENGTKDIINDMSGSAPSSGKHVINSEYRSPGLAFLFSFLLPGGGQYYNHQYTKGGVMTGLWVAGIITTAAATPSFNDCYQDYYGNWICGHNGHDEPNPAAVVGGTVIFGTWLWSVIDAPINAARINRNNKTTGLLEFQKEDKFSLRFDPFRSQGLGGAVSMRF